jgi:hypothetical protein
MKFDFSNSDNPEYESTITNLINDIDSRNTEAFKVIKNELLLPQQSPHVLCHLLKSVLITFLHPIFSPLLEKAFGEVPLVYSPVDALKLLVLPSPLSTSKTLNEVWQFIC